MPPCKLPVAKECWPELTSDLDLAKMQICADAAAEFIWEKTGQRFGYCPVIVRPCPSPFAKSVYPLWDGVDWRQTGCGCRQKCDRRGPSIIHLPGPVYEVTLVEVDGECVPETEWSVEGDYLYKADCTPWPVQNLLCPLGQPNTWSVEYLRGYAPPAGTALAVGMLAKEFFNACGKGKCRLPNRVQSIVRQGVNMQIINTKEILDEGLTGIPEVDFFIRTWNPRGVTGSAIVF